MKTSRQFYEEFGLDRLMDRRDMAGNEKELSYLKKLIGKDKKLKILDMACGFGRMTIPLVESGYDVEGVDISPNFIIYAKKEARRKKLKIKFIVGDMRALPFRKESFDIVLCLWSSFNEVSRKKDQVIVVKEMLKVLRTEGMGFIEMAKPDRHLKDFRKGKIKIFRKKGHLNYFLANGIETMPSYAHTKETLKRIMVAAKVDNYKIFFDDYGGRERMLLQFWK